MSVEVKAITHEHPELLSNIEDLEDLMKKKAQEMGLVLMSKDGKSTPIPFFPIPLTLSPSSSEILNQSFYDAQTIYRVLRKAEDWIIGHDHGDDHMDLILPYLPEAEQVLITSGTKRHPNTADRRNTRFDAFLTPDGIKIIELNSICPEGIHYHDVLRQLGTYFMKLIGAPIDNQNRSAANQVLEMILAEFQDRNPGQNLSRIGIFYDQDSVSDVNRAELPRLAEYFMRTAKDRYDLSIDAVVGDVRQIDVIGVNNINNRRRRQAFLDGKPIDAFWRNNLEPSLYSGLSSSGRKSVPGLIEIITNPDKYVVMNDEGGRLMGNKLLFALLHDPNIQRILFTDKEIATIKRVIPLTAPFTEENLVNFINSGKPFVVKPIVGVHGKGVCFSQNYPNPHDLINKIDMPQYYIIQEQIPYPSITIPTIQDGQIQQMKVNFDFNIHHINGVASGTFISRASPSSDAPHVLNVAAGGGLLIII